MSPVNEYQHREWWSIGEFSSEFLKRTGRQLHANTVYRAIASGRLPAQKQFGQWRVHRDAIETLLGTDAEDKRTEEFTLDDQRGSAMSQRSTFITGRLIAGSLDVRPAA